MNKLPLVLIPRNLHCLEKFLVVLVLNYENGEKWNSVFVYIGSCRESIREFQTAFNFSSTSCYALLQIKLNGQEIFEQLCATSVKTDVQFVNLL